jgi:DinB superfamily
MFDWWRAIERGGSHETSRIFAGAVIGERFGFFMGLFASCRSARNQTGANTRKQVDVTNEQLLAASAVNSWKLIIGRIDQGLAALSDEKLQTQVAPGKNRLFYLLGHLTAVHDRLFTMLSIGERLHPELDEPFLTNPDKGGGRDPITAVDLRAAWSEINSKLTAAFERFTPAEWVQKHTAVSDEDFAKDPSRNRLAVVLSRTNHASFHTGQIVLAK